MENLKSWVCRTCLKVFGENDYPLCIYDISDILMSFTSLVIVRNDGLPFSLCNYCHKEAMRTYNFKLLCEESDQKLRTDLHYISTDQEQNNVTAADSEAECIGDVANPVDKFDPSASMDHQMTGDDYLIADDNIIIDIDNATVKIKYESENSDSVSPDDVIDNDASIVQNNTENDCDSDSDSELSSKLTKECDDDDNRASSPDSNEEVQWYKCRFCDTSSIHLKNLLRHEIKHGKGVKCFICGKEFTHVYKLNRHMENHDDRRGRLCQICGKEFTFASNLSRHMHIHSGNRPHKCEICDKTYIQSNELKNHMDSHSVEKHYLCNICGGTYKGRVSLRIHMGKVHSMSRSQTLKRTLCACNICGKQFEGLTNLRQHRQIHKEKKHVCKICNKLFNRRSNLRIHEWIHTGHRPFQCYVCCKTFNQSSILYKHLKTHST